MAGSEGPESYAYPYLSGIELFWWCAPETLLPKAAPW